MGEIKEIFQSIYLNKLFFTYEIRIGYIQNVHCLNNSSISLIIKNKRFCIFLRIEKSYSKYKIILRNNYIYISLELLKYFIKTLSNNLIEKSSNEVKTYNNKKSLDILNLYLLSLDTLGGY